MNWDDVRLRIALKLVCSMVPSPKCGSVRLTGDHCPGSVEVDGTVASSVCVACGVLLHAYFVSGGWLERRVPGGHSYRAGIVRGHVVLEAVDLLGDRSVLAEVLPC